MSGRKLREGWEEAYVSRSGGPYERMAIRGNQIRRWEEASKEPALAAPCGGDTGKCPVVGRGPEPKFEGGQHVCRKSDPQTVVVLGHHRTRWHGGEWRYELAGNDVCDVPESDLALPPKYPVGTWGGGHGTSGSWPIGAVEWDTSVAAWMYWDERRSSYCHETLFEVRPPDPSCRWPKGCGPLPGAPIHIVEHLATHEGHTFSERDSARLAAAQHGRILKAGQIRHDSQRGPMVAFSGMADYGQEIELFNCVPAETA